MGCDIHGVIEVDWYGSLSGDYENRSWKTIVDNIGFLVGRSYDSFGCLFGVRNYANMEPIAQNRGVPDNLSSRAKERVEDDRDWCHSFTYVTYEELQNVDWDEKGGTDDRVSVVDEDGNSSFKAGYMPAIDKLSEEQSEKLRRGEKVEHPSEEDKYLKCQSYTRRESLSGAWNWLIFDIMDGLAEKFGAENVRMVVWFDN